ncbi:hypothetical protein [Streptomyces sp. NPDC101166]|uniref:hypothetical protein n=1 Tax=Streptomyces sp. NPDC101166 TaxID=3366120 RepID=UPI0037F6417A
MNDLDRATDLDDGEAVRELLGRAVADVRPPAGRDGGSVFTTAARIRRRRRAATTGVVVGVIAVSATLGSGVLRTGDEKTPVAASPTARAPVFQDLLPKGVGKVTKISLEKILTDREPTGPQTIGPYDGDYAVARGGGIGYLQVQVIDPATRHRYKKDTAFFAPCDASSPESSYPRQRCTEEAVAGGRLSIWQYTSTNRSDGSSLQAQLLLKDGTVLTVGAWEGFSGKKALGPLLKGFPLDREQLRELMLRKELLP